jgi:hypothetical protein
MTAPEIRGEKVEIYGYKAWIVKKAYLTVGEEGLNVRPVVYVVVKHPEDAKGCYIYEIKYDDEWTYDWHDGRSVAELYREIEGKIDALYTMVREKIAAFNVLKELLEKEGVVVSAMCWGYYKSIEDAVKITQ